MLIAVLGMVASMKLLIHSWLFLLLSFSQIVIADDALCQRALTLSSTEDWYPYIFVDEQGTSVGADLLLLENTLAEIGCQLDIVHFPERRSLLEINKGNFDIGLGASKNSERLKKILV